MPRLVRIRVDGRRRRTQNRNQARYRRMMLKLSANMPNFTLHYYAIRGYGELARLMFAHSGIQFTDHRMQWDEWQEEKKNRQRFPFGIAPTLELDGQIMWDSSAINRYLAWIFGLTGRNNKDMARCDVAVGILKELRTEMMQAAPYFLLETDEAKIAQLQAEVFGRMFAPKMAALEKIFKESMNGRGFFIGDYVTWSDLSLVDVGYNMIQLYPAALDNTPSLKTLYKKVMALPKIRKYCNTRPLTSA